MLGNPDPVSICLSFQATRFCDAIVVYNEKNKYSINTIRVSIEDTIWNKFFIYGKLLVDRKSVV